MKIYELNLDQLELLTSLIGNGVRPIRAGKLFFPNKPKGFTNTTKDIRSYCWNKITSLKSDKCKTRLKYLEICSEIFLNLPDYAKEKDYIADKCSYGDFTSKECFICESDFCMYNYI